MIKVIYEFPVEVVMPIGTALGMKEGFEDLLNGLGMGIGRDIGSTTLSWESEDGKGLTTEQNKAVVKILQEDVFDTFRKENKKYKDWKFTVKKGVRQDEPDQQKIASSKAADTKNKSIGQPASLTSGNNSKLSGGDR